MKRHEMWNQVVAVALVAALMFFPSLSMAQEKGTPFAKWRPTATRDAGKPYKPGAAEGEVSRGGPEEGIRVHGHWTIVIENPDGAVVSQHEFENSLVNTGPDLLAQLLARMATPGAWEINLLK